jgi:predicted nucleotide-binding protein (sugar kinase/HSP70/actin superfamily)
MLVYILGEEILNESENLKDNWDNYLTDENIEAIINNLNEFINI